MCHFITCTASPSTAGCALRRYLWRTGYGAPLSRRSSLIDNIEVRLGFLRSRGFVQLAHIGEPLNRQPLLVVLACRSEFVDITRKLGARSLEFGVVDVTHHGVGRHLPIDYIVHGNLAVVRH